MFAVFKKLIFQMSLTCVNHIRLRVISSNSRVSYTRHTNCLENFDSKIGANIAKRIVKHATNKLFWRYKYDKIFC